MQCRPSKRWSSRRLRSALPQNRRPSLAPIPESYFSSLVVLHTSFVCPVFESITVVRGWQLQVTVLLFSCLTTTQCSISSAVAGGNWLRVGGGVAATGCFFAAHPARSKQNMRPTFLILSVFALLRSLVDGNLGYTESGLRTQFHKCSCNPYRQIVIKVYNFCWGKIYVST